MSKICRLRRLGSKFAALGMLSWFLAGCGGGNVETTPPPPPPLPPDFSISVSPATLALGIGDGQMITVSATAVNAFTAGINVSVSGLPAGVTAAPATFSLSPGNQQQMTITAASSAQPTMATLIFQGTSGSLSHSTQTSLSIVAQVSGVHPPIRTHYLRTNSFYPDSFQDAPPHFTVYDAAHKQFFVSSPYLNEIDVFDAAQEIETAQIPVPLAWGLDVSPYNGSLYAGTLIGDIYQIDTSTLSITSRYPSASIGRHGFTATTALVLSDGRLALQGGIGEAAFLGVDGFGVSAVWDPVTNSLDTGTDGSVCDVGNEGAFAVSGDRTRILVTTVDEGGGGEPICSYDPIAKQATLGVFPDATFVRQIIPTPDGDRFFLTAATNGVAVFDAKTVQLLGQITSPNLGIPNLASGAVMSLDGKTLYLVDQLSGAVGGFDTTLFTQSGWVPSFGVMDSQSGLVVSAIDETGLIAGPIGHGVGFVDASQMTTAEPTFIHSGFGSPATGPLAGGTTVANFAYGNVADSAILNQVYVGNAPGAFATFAARPSSENAAQVTVPPSAQVGAVDLAVVLSDGGVGLAPEGFSYGPTILEVVPNGATAEGGQTGAIIGYGFGDSISEIQITVGGQSAPVTAVYNYPFISPYPFPANSLQFIIPPGAAGAAVDVTVTTPSGSFTATGAFHYTAAVESYPVTANLQAGIYDAGRDLYYFADQAQIQVLSKSGGNWLSPISLPGTSSKTQLLAISESPDGTKLAVSDFGGQTIYVLNPDSPATATSYPMSLDKDGSSTLMAPSGLAITDTGMVYFDTSDISGTGTPLFHKLNTTTNSIHDLGMLQSAGSSDNFSRVLLSPDGSKVFTVICGDVCISYWLDTSNDQINDSVAYLIEDFPDLAISGDGSEVDSAGEWADSSLNRETIVTYIDWETWFPIAANGQKLNQDGSILFSPLTDGIDMVPRNTGRLLYRIQIPMTPANVYDVLVIAKGQNTLGVISATGVSFVDLSSLPIPSADMQPFMNTTHSQMRPLADRQIPPVAKRALSNPSTYPSARPKLRRRLGQSKTDVKSP
jgi:hypothetical protein